MGKKTKFAKMGGAILLFLTLSLGVNASNITVRGNVTDTAGEPLIGATVQVVGIPTLGAITNFNGDFELSNVAPDATLQASFMGMEMETVPVNGRTVINFILRDTFSDLDELVVIGYGVRRRALATGALADVSGEQIANMRTTTAMEALQGVVPGVQIRRNDGMPGAGTTVTIRGQGTIGTASPLFVVDGVAVSNIDFLNPSDIERIDVMRDAASAAIFGARAANGVIMVTTTRGRARQQARVTYSGSFGLQNKWRRLVPLNAQQYMFLLDEASINDGGGPIDWYHRIVGINNPWLEGAFPGAGREMGEYIWSKLQSGWTGTDWVDEMTMRNAPMQSHAFNITGGTEKSTYAFGFSYFNQSSIIGGHITDAGIRRMTVRMNTETVLFSNPRHNVLTFGQNLMFTNNRNRPIRRGDQFSNDLRNAISAHPLMLARWDNPRVNQTTRGWGPTMDGIAWGINNPLAVLYDAEMYHWRHNNTIVGNVYGILEPIPGLRYRSAFGINAWISNSRQFQQDFRLSASHGRPRHEDVTNSSMTQGINYTWTNTVTYDWTMNDDHNFHVLLGTEMLKSVFNMTVSGMRRNSIFGHPDHALLTNNAPPGSVSDVSVSGTNSALMGGGLMSYMTRLSYNFASRYMIDLVLRRDGSSNFAPDRRWGNFPSVSLGWIFTEEQFMRGVEWMDFGRVRLSWGQNGNQSISNFLYLANIGFLPGGGPPMGPNREPGTGGLVAHPVNVPNPNVTWETSEQINFGIDTRMLRSRLAFNMDVYRRTTRDWLVQAPVLGTTGANAPMINGGDVQNQGVELMLSWNDRVGNFRYGATVTGTINRNKVTRLANAEGIIRGPNNLLAWGTSHVSQVSVGRPIGYFYGFRTNGIFQNQAEVDAWVTADGRPIVISGDSPVTRPGDVRFVDMNGDGIIDDSDKVMLGSPHPDFELGLQLNAEYRGFFVNTTLVGMFGMQVMQSFRNWGGDPMSNRTIQDLNRWHGEGTSNTVPRHTIGAHPNLNLMSDIHMRDACFLRISNLTIGYRFNHLLRDVSWLQAASVNMTVNNLHTFTRYDGMDPEIGWGGVGWASGIDLGLFPLARTVIFGVNLTF